MPRVSEFPTRTAAQQPTHGATFPSFRPIPPALFSFHLIFLLVSFFLFSLFSDIAMEATKCDGSRGPFTSLSSPLGYHPPIFCTLPPFMPLPPSVSVPISVVHLLSASFSLPPRCFRYLVVWSFFRCLCTNFQRILAGPPFLRKFPANLNDALPTVQTHPATLQIQN